MAVTAKRLVQLDITANKETDLEAARKVKKARENLFQIITTVA